MEKSSFFNSVSGDRVYRAEEWAEYSYKGALYLAKADMPNCVYPPDTAGLWQWEKV